MEGSGHSRTRPSIPTNPLQSESIHRGQDPLPGENGPRLQLWRQRKEIQRGIKTQGGT